MTRVSDLALALVASLATAAVWASDTSDFCSSVTSCLQDGSTACDTTTGDCPPCIYALDNTYTCWEKDNSTNTCPFTGVRYDCSDSWSTSSSSSSTTSKSTSTSSSSTDTSVASSASTASSASSSATSADTASSASTGGLSSSLITYGAIGLGALLIIVIVIILCVRRRKTQRRREEAMAATGVGNFGQRNRDRALSDKRGRGMSKRDDALAGPYNNILDTSKVNYTTPGNMNPGPYGGGYGNHRKASRSDPAMMEAGRDSNDQSFVSRVPTDDSLHSFDGMLADSAHSPAMLGGGSHKGSNRNMQNAPVVGGIGGFSSVNELVQQDVSTRCTATPNVFGEYLRMKQEMQYEGDADRSTSGGLSISDSVSELDSGKYSFESAHELGRLPTRRTDLDDGRSSMADSIADSVTDSEYAEHLRARGESDCFSEMSYNDEKYSFTESLDGLDDSQARGTKKREVEI